MEKRRSLSRKLLLTAVMGVGFSTAVVGYLWASAEYRHHLASAQKIYDLELSKRKSYLKESVDDAIAFINHRKSKSRQLAMELVRTRSNEAYSLASHLYETFKNDMSRDELSSIIREALREVRYNGGKGYYFVTRADGVAVLVPDKPELEGHNLLGDKDEHGQLYVRDLIEIARKQGEGYYEYSRTKPGVEDREFRKVSHVKYFEPLGWVIGTGEYLDDMEEAIREDVLEYLGGVKLERASMDGYLFIGQWDGLVLGHPAKGRNMYEVTDTNGLKIVQELIRLAKQGGGFLSYVMPELSGERPLPKVSYVAGVRDWQWFVGTGAYIADIERDFNAAVASARMRALSNLGQAAFTILIVGAVGLFIALRTVRRTRRELTELEKFFETSKSGELADFNPEKLSFDEFRHLASVASEMVRERESSRSKLLLSEQRMELAFEAAEIGFWDWEVKTGKTYFSKKYFTMLGYDEYELEESFDTWANLLHPDDRERTQRELARALAMDEPKWALEFRCRAKNGTYRWISGRGKVVERDEEGKPLRAAGVHVDVTQLKAVEESLHKRARSMSTLLEVSGKLSVSLDREQILQATVDGVTQLVGLDTAAVYLAEGDRVHLEATTPELPADFPARLKEGLLREHRHMHMAITNGEALFLPDLRGVSLSETERKIVEQRGLKAILFFPLIADGVALGAFIVGSTKGEAHLSELELDMCHTYANLASLAIRNAQLFKERQDYVVQLEAALEDRIRAEEEARQLQEQLLQAQKIESIGRLAGGVAHDFNNKLQIIIGYAENALSRIDQDNPLYEPLQAINAAASQSADITRQLLAFARKQTINPTLLDLNETIEGLLKMLRRFMREEIELHWLPGANLWTVSSDPSQIDQLLANLCVNARDAIEGVGEITIQTKNVTLDQGFCNSKPGCAPGEYVLVRVSDTGSGMDRETVEHIFEPFFTTKDMGKGTGLGLATAYGIVAQNRGVIDVQSQPGVGTDFMIYLPRKEGEKISEELPSDNVAQAGSGETILLVEDDEGILGLGRAILENMGYKVLSASTPEEGLNLADQHRGEIALLITDVIMPGMNGQQLAARLTEGHPDLKVLFMSGYTAEIITHDGKIDPGLNFIQKPFSLKEFQQKTRQVLSR